MLSSARQSSASYVYVHEFVTVPDWRHFRGMLAQSALPRVRLSPHTPPHLDPHSHIRTDCDLSK
jgi:hypothetical protein